MLQDYFQHITISKRIYFLVFHLIHKLLSWKITNKGCSHRNLLIWA